MPIVASDIEFRLSGGSSNALGNLAIGGAISSSVVSSILNGLFDYVTGDESAAGDIEYRCIYVRNSHASLTLYGAKIWIDTNTPSTFTVVDIGLGSSAINGTEQIITNENSAPSGVSFSAPSGAAAALLIGDMTPGQSKAVWIRRTVTAGAQAFANDSLSLTVRGDTSA